MTRPGTPEIVHGAPPHGAGLDPADGGRGGGSHRRASLTGVYVLIAGITMLFAAFTSAMVVRRGLGGDWIELSLPRVAWWNAVVLVASSAAVEIARRALHRGERTRFNRYWSAATALGLVFLAGQFAAWAQLRAAGLYVSTNPSSAFFYVLTVAHALHVAGGIGALAYIDVQALRLRLGPGKRTGVDVSAIYWHFLDGLWLYVLLLFRFWG
jgi:cytochrome c oxidase subunit 3